MSRPLLPLLLFIINFTPPSAVRTTGTDVCCHAHRCGGNGTVHIKYPFWTSSRKGPTYANHSRCSQPSFNITCCENGTAIARFIDGNHAVKSIDYDTRTLTLVDAKALAACDTTCPKLHANVSFDRFPALHYVNGVVNLTFFYDCNVNALGKRLSSKIAKNRITCRLDGSNSSDSGDNASYMFSCEETISKSLYVHCGSVVVAPVAPKAMNLLANDGTRLVGKMLSEGFSLRWTEDCRRKGQTGSTLESDCDGSEGSQNPAGLCGHHKKGEVSVKWKAITGACSLCAGFVLASVCFVAWLRHGKRRRRRRHQISSLTKTPRSTLSVVDPDTHDVHYYRTRIFSYGELKDATDGFAAVNELGDGGFGTVYKGKLLDGRVVAVKRLYEKNCKRVEQFMNEVWILSLLRHENLVTLYGCTSRHSRELLLVYEFVPNGTVADHLHGSRAAERALTWPVRLKIAVETAGALAYLHAVDPQIIHRDVKTTNILLDGEFRVKVADFGLSRSTSPEVSHVSTLPQGTPGYVDPEYHWTYKLTDKSDVYSFGVVLVELMSSMPPIDIARRTHEVGLANLAVSKIQNGLLDELVDQTLGFGSDEKVTTMVGLVAELAFMCLQAEKEMRPTMDEVLQTLQEIANR